MKTTRTTTATKSPKPGTITYYRKLLAEAELDADYAPDQGRYECARQRISEIEGRIMALGGRP